MVHAKRSFIEYLRVERNSSAHTVRNYRSDLEQFERFLVPSASAGGSRDSAQEAAQEAANEPKWSDIDPLKIRA
ncbi:MAG: site-specific integrase, partial [Nitrospirae bacterium]|nr:site-specific integrase [Nitrospirota bacterium]